MIIWFAVILGSTLGSYLPALFGAGWLSLWSIVLGTVGGLAGLWVGYKVTR